MRGVEQVIRVLSLLTYDKPAWGLRELARTAALSKSAAHRILHELVTRDFVVKTEEQKYRIGPGAYAWAAAALSRLSLREIALPVMKRVVAECDETVVLAVRNDSQLYFVEKVESSHPVRYVPPMGIPLPLHAGAAGKVMLAFMSPEERRRVVGARLAKITPRTITTPAAVRAELALVKARGWAASAGERIAGTAGIAAPILDARGSVVGSLDLVMPEARLEGFDVEAAGRLLKSASSDISRQLGFPDHDGGANDGGANGVAVLQRAESSGNERRRIRPRRRPVPAA